MWAKRCAICPVLLQTFSCSSMLTNSTVEKKELVRNFVCEA